MEASASPTPSARPIRAKRSKPLVVDDDSEDEIYGAERRKRRKRVKKACPQCRKAHSSCDNQRPCKRCVSMCLECELGWNQINKRKPAPGPSLIKPYMETTIQTKPAVKTELAFGVITPQGRTIWKGNLTHHVAPERSTSAASPSDLSDYSTSKEEPHDEASPAPRANTYPNRTTQPVYQHPHYPRQYSYIPEIPWEFSRQHYPAYQQMRWPGFPPSYANGTPPPQPFPHFPHQEFISYPHAYPTTAVSAPQYEQFPHYADSHGDRDHFFPQGHLADSAQQLYPVPFDPAVITAPDASSEC